MNAKTIILNTIDCFGVSWSVEYLVERVYNTLKGFGFEPVIVNGKGIEVPGDSSLGDHTVWFRRNNKKNIWRAFQVVDLKNIYLD